jgi:hypothetical protein
LVAVTLLTAGQVSAPTARAHAGAPAHTNGDCDAGTEFTGGELIAHIVRNRPAGDGFNAVAADLVAQELYPCFSPNVQATVGKSLVMAVNLQGSAAFLQAGIGKMNFGSTGRQQCSGVEALQNNTLNFIYVPDAGSGGVFCRAWWVDFNNNGTPDNPVPGRTYTFSITNPSLNVWRYCITDTTLGQTDCRDAFSLAWEFPFVWTGFEAARTSDAMGTTEAAADLLIRKPRYKYLSLQNVWTYMTGGSLFWAGGNGMNHPCEYKVIGTGDGIGVKLNGYTSLHTTGTLCPN